MRIRKRIDKRIEHDKDGVQVSAAVNAVVNANVGESGSVTAASSRQHVDEREDGEDDGPGEREPSGPSQGGKRADLEQERARELPDREGTYDELRESRPKRKRTKERTMSDDARTTGQMSKVQLEAEMGRELTDREAMSLVNANVAIPINAAVAANVLSDHAIAVAEATQQAQIDQAN